MEVTSSNFKEVLPRLSEALKQATFVAVDCEFSGLNAAWEIRAFDTPQQYYQKVRRNCMDFLVIQYGLSIFRLDPEDGKFKQQSYNFYIFRRPINRNIPDQRFLCQTSSIHFLITQGFDFNKLFSSGIPYLNITEEERYQESLEERHKIRASNQAPQRSELCIPEDAQPIISAMLKKIDEFLVGDADEMELPKCNSYHRKLIYQSTARSNKYHNRVVVKTNQMENGDRILVVSRYKSKDDLEETEKRTQEQEVAAMDDFTGFTKVMRLLVDSNKLVIGHNMCLDLLHSIDKFLTPLPEDYQEFKDCAHSIFPRILDTKYMATSDDFKDDIPSTVLAELVDILGKEPFGFPEIEIESGCEGYSLAEKKEHEAGYDAYITGLCFLAMWKHLGDSKKGAATFENFKLLEPYLNRLFLMFLRDNPYINLGGPDPNPSRDHVFFLTFPKEWRLTNITELFSPFGNVYVAWLSDTSAYVGLYRKDQAPVALNTLSQSDTYSIMTFKRHQQLLSDASTYVQSTTNRKRALEVTPQPGKKMRTSREALGRFVEDPEPSSNSTPPKTSKTWTLVGSDSWD